MRIVILTGAGLSAESGLGTFRDARGLWSRVDLAEVATPEGFADDPAKVHAFYNDRRSLAASAEPNAAHLALASLAAAEAHDITLVTQNVDNLHAKAGSEALQMHGDLFGARCLACQTVYEAPMALRGDEPCPRCAHPGARPDVVWFGEMPRHVERIERAISRCHLFAAIGTSGEVWPAAGFVDLAAEAGARTVEINLEPGRRASRFHEQIHGLASETVPRWVAGLLAGPHAS